jgi:hypothetical protein
MIHNRNDIVYSFSFYKKKYGLVGIRTPGQSVKSRLLYLAELQAQNIEGIWRNHISYLDITLILVKKITLFDLSKIKKYI